MEPVKCLARYLLDVDLIPWTISRAEAEPVTVSSHLFAALFTQNHNTLMRIQLDFSLTTAIILLNSLYRGGIRSTEARYCPRSHTWWVEGPAEPLYSTHTEDAQYPVAGEGRTLG